MNEKKYNEKDKKQSLDFLTKMALMNRKTSDVHNSVYYHKKNNTK